MMEYGLRQIGCVAGTVVALVAFIPVNPVAAQGPPQISVEQLSTDGWEIAGYGALSIDGRSLILFKHKDRHYLVQCSVLYDVTRSKRVVTNCYEVR